MSYPADCGIVLDHCSWSDAALTLDWLDVEIGDMLSSVSGVVESPSYDGAAGIFVALLPLSEEIHQPARPRGKERTRLTA